MSRKIRSIVLILAVLAFPGTLWRWLTGNAPGFAFFWEKEGSDMDPDGRMAPRSFPPASTNAGPDMDPNGVKAGSEMDPDGRTAPRPATDSGPEMDPNG